MSVARTWYVSCSPRSPEKIAPELALLARFDGVLWYEKDKLGHNKHQLAFAELLKECETFEGSISAQNPDFSARDRIAPMKTCGFAHEDAQGRMRITPAGWQLIRGERIQELFLKQMLKWQYPSYQHGGHFRTRHNYLPAKQMNVFPFVVTLDLAWRLEGLSKREIAAFVLPILHKDQVDKAEKAISQFRESLAAFPGGRPRKEHADQVHRERFRVLYADDIRAGRIATREARRAATMESFIATKVRNSLDIADAAIRYFRATGLFTLEARTDRLVISDFHRQEADQVLDTMTFEPVPFYADVERFYEYMGNPEIPLLPWEDRAQLVAKVMALQPDMDRPTLLNISISELKNLLLTLEEQHKQTTLEGYTVSLQQPSAVLDIVDMFERIRRKEVIDPPLFLEWNTWRALVALNDYHRAQPNFIMDHDLQPLNCAGGKQADIEIEYNGFVLLVEVTLTGGLRQYEAEGEPVTRHIGEYQLREQRSPKPRMTYGLFIAPTINPTTHNYFYVHLKHLAAPHLGGHVVIIPLTLAQFVDIFRFVKTEGRFSRHAFGKLLEQLVMLKEHTTDSDQWVGAFPSVIEAWKQEVLSSGLN